MRRTLLPEFFLLCLLPHLPLFFSLSSAPLQLPVTPNLAAGQSKMKEMLAIGLFVKEERGRAVIMSTIIAVGLMTAHQTENPGVGPPLFLLTSPFLLLLCSTNRALFRGCTSQPPSAPPCLGSLHGAPESYVFSHRGSWVRKTTVPPHVRFEPILARRERFYHSHFCPFSLEF